MQTEEIAHPPSVIDYTDVVAWLERRARADDLSGRGVLRLEASMASSATLLIVWR